MLGPVSDTGRAMMASLQQAIQKGMPIDQAIAYVKGMATQGVAPMVDLYSMLNQFERLKQPQVPPPQGGTIRDQIAMAAAQRDHQEAMRRGLASMPVQRAPQEPMEQGLGSVPVPAMEGAQFAGGGIVAFGDGGPTNKSIDYTDPRSVLNSLVGQYGGDPTDYLTREATAQEEAYKRMGLGAAAKAREEETARQQAEAEKYASTAGQGNLAQYFFELAANAAKPGAKFLTAAAAAAPGYGQRRTEIDERARALKNAAKESQLKLMEAEELRKAGYLKDAEARRRDGVKQMIDVGSEIYKAKTQKDVAAIYTAPRGAEVDIAKLKHIIATEKGDTPESQAKIADAQKKLNIIDKNLAAIQGRFNVAQLNNITKRLTSEYAKLQDRLTKSGLTMEPADKQAVQDEIDSIEQQADALGIGASTIRSLAKNAVPTVPGAPEAPVAPQSNPVGGTRLRYNPATGKIE